MARRFGGARPGSPPTPGDGRAPVPRRRPESVEESTDPEPLTHCEFCGAEYEVPSTASESRPDASEADTPDPSPCSRSCTPMRRRAIVTIAAVVQIGLLASALADLYRRRPAQVRGDRRVWAVASFVSFVGPAEYFLLGRRGRQSG